MPPIVLRTLRVLGHLNALPNTLLALLGSAGGRLHLDRANEVIEVRGGLLARINHRLGYGGMAVGDVLLSELGLPPNVYRHELVHVTQARILGAFYLPATVICYLVGFLTDPSNAHDASPMEVMADFYAGTLPYNRSRLAARLRDRRQG